MNIVNIAIHMLFYLFSLSLTANIYNINIKIYSKYMNLEQQIGKQTAITIAKSNETVANHTHFVNCSF